MKATSFLINLMPKQKTWLPSPTNYAIEHHGRVVVNTEAK